MTRAFFAAACGLALCVPLAAQDNVKTLDEYVKDLDHASPKVRVKALQILGAARKGEALPKMLALLAKDREAHVRVEAAHALGYYGAADAHVLAALAVALRKDANPAVRGAAARVVMELGPRAKPAAAALKDALLDGDALVRVHAARALWGVDGNAAAVLPVLTAAARGDKGADAEARNWACFHLSVLGPAGKAAAPVLRQVLESAPAPTRVYAAQALWKTAADPEALWALADLSRRDEEVRATADEVLFTLGTEALPVLRPGLKAKDAHRRAQAAWALRALREHAEAAVPDLVAALADADERVRDAAAAALARAGPHATPALLQALADPRAAVVSGALAALRQVPGVDAKQLLPRLTPLLKHADVGVRVRAAELVWEGQGDAGVVLPFFRAGVKHADAAVRGVAARGLGRLLWLETGEGKAALELLRERLNDANLDVRRAAVRALTAPAPAAADRGDSPFGPGGPPVNPGLRDPATLAALLERLQEDDEDIDRELVPALARTGVGGKAAVSPLARCLSGKQPLIRREAARALGRIGGGTQAAVPALALALRGGDAELRQMAVLALGGIGPDGGAAVEDLAGLLKSQDNVLVLTVLDALGRIGPAAKPAVPALTAFLKARLAAPAPGGEAVQVPLLDGGSRAVAPGGEVVLAIDALAAIGPDAAPATELLLQIVGGQVPEQARAAISALGNIGKETLPKLAQAVAKARPEVRGHYLDVLVESGIEAGVVTPRLVDGLRDDSAEVRQRAAFNLGRLGPKAVAAVKPLAALLADVKQDEDVRGTAAQALGEIGPAARAALPVLRAALGDEAAYVRQWAAFALGEFGAEARAALPRLRELLKDRDGNVRKAAATAVKKIANGS
jgi:HEAT repeat protein